MFESDSEILKESRNSIPENFNEKTGDFVKPELPDTEIEKNRDREFVNSFDISPAQRGELKSFIKYLKGGEGDLKPGVLGLIHRSEKFSPDILRSDYLKRLALNVLEEFLSSDHQYNTDGNWPYLKESFDIDEDFFKSDLFVKFKRNNWLHRIKYGELISDPARSRRDYNGDIELNQDIEKIEKKERIENLEYGKFGEANIDIDSSEVKSMALEAIVHKVLWPGSYGSQLAYIKEYKKLFKISEKEFELAVIDKISKDKIDNLKNCNELRSHYSFIDKFLSSPLAKKLAKQEAEGRYINSTLGYWPDDLLNYYSLKKGDFNFKALKEKKRLYNYDYLIERINNEKDEEYIFYSIEQAQDILQPEDWQKIIQEFGNSERFINGIAYALTRSFGLEAVISILNRIGAPEGLIKKSAIKSIELQLRNKDGVRYDNIANLKNQIGLTDQEFNEAITKGLIVLMQFNCHIHDLERILEEFGIKELSDSPEIQNQLRELYNLKVEKTDQKVLEFIDEKFKINWSSEDGPARFNAVKKALCDEYRLGSFNSAKDIKKFIDNYYPETHKIFLINDHEVTKAVKKMLTNLPFYADYINKDRNFVNETIKIFNVTKEQIYNAIKKRISDGQFISDDKQEYNFKHYLPEIDLEQENEKCLANRWSEIVEQAFESKNWKVLREIQKYENTEAKREIQRMIALQEKNLTDKKKSPEVRLYAVEALTNLSKILDSLENQYPRELIEIYTAVDTEKLIDLFKRKSELFNSLDGESRSLAFDQFLSLGEKFGLAYKGGDPCEEILKRDSIAFLNSEQTRTAFHASQYESAVIGLKQTLKNKIAVPEYLFDGLYNRLIDEKKENLTGSAPAGFATSLIELLKIDSEAILRNRGILKEIALNPNSITTIKKVIEQMPVELLNSNWSYIYNQLKNLPEAEFDRQKSLMQKLNPYRNSWWLKDLSFQSIFEQVLAYTPEQQKEFFEILELNKNPLPEFNNENWSLGIVSYVSAAEEENRLQFDNDKKAKVLELFSGSYKDIALAGLHKEWLSFLGNKNENTLSPSLFLVSKIIDDAGGAGNLKYIESLGNLIYQVKSVLDHKTTTERTKAEIKRLLADQENRISRERWSQDDRSEYYNLSHDIIEAAPSLYAAFAPLLEQLNPKEMKLFLSDAFSLYQAQLVTLQKVDNNGEPIYQSRDLAMVRLSVRQLADNLRAHPEEKTNYILREKTRLLEAIKESFKERFGILKIPNEFNKENIRSVQNCVRYLGNINARNTTKEAIIAFYLSLELNGEWDKFRQGGKIKPAEYLSQKQLEVIEPILEEKMKSHLLPLELAGIPPEKAKRFQELLQEDVISSMVGNIQTVDVKLGNVKRNIEELADPDIYNKQSEKDIMRLLIKEGKLVGTVLAKTYNEASGKKVEINDQERTIRAELAAIFGIDSWSLEQVKRIQDQIQPFGLIANMVNKMEEEKVDENITELQRRLTPSDRIIQIFNRLGEDFKQESGALALAKDLSYLESLVIKDDNKLTVEERAAVEEYLDSIKEKMKDLELMLDKVKEYFSKIKKSSHLSNHELLKNRLADIEKIVNSEDANAMIVSRMTKDLNLIIENMRQCLGCLRREVNNDTNLAFGDYNKFFMINQAEKDKGSISDEILFFAPIKTLEGKSEMSFVMDRVYGSKSSDILISNILSVFKKYQAIKKEIPEAKISISVTNEAMSSVGLNSELLHKRLKEVLPGIKFAEQINEMTVNIPKSAFSDNYVEFGAGVGARESGDRQFSGFVIR
ncbi:MAG: hypothetical protein WC621_01655 [Patescibacteria group bacterium]